jgi:hypothetical protein
MHYIPIESLLIGLIDLLTKRIAALQLFANGVANVKLLTSMRDKISALPAALLGRPLTDELDAADGRHDGLGGAIWFIVEAYLRHPDSTPAMITAAKNIRTVLIPKLDLLGATYEAEAEAAVANKAALAGLKADLDLFPVAAGTLYDWAVKFVQAAEGLAVLLSQRADAKDRAAAAVLRTETIGILNRMRKSLAAEMKEDPSLPADLDDQVFAFFDQMEMKAADAHTEAKAKAKAAKAAKDAAKAGAPAGTPPAAGTPLAPPAPPAG